MTSAYLTNPIVFLIQTLFGLYAAIILLRFLLQWARADFYNPVSQFVVKVTTPVLHPLRQLIPGYAGLDLAALLLAWLVKTIELSLVALIAVPGASAFGAAAWAVPELVDLTINIFIFAVLIRVVLSWVNPDPYHPIASLLGTLTEPIMRPASRILPPVGGLDLSPVLVMVALVLIKMLVMPPLDLLTGNPF
jgi:YggT family protein